jgi:hypothetical protein
MGRLTYFRWPVFPLAFFKRCDRERTGDRVAPAIARDVAFKTAARPLSGVEPQARYHPSLLVALLVYGYATGAFSSRTLEGGA